MKKKSLLFLSCCLLTMGLMTGCGSNTSTVETSESTVTTDDTITNIAETDSQDTKESEENENVDALAQQYSIDTKGSTDNEKLSIEEVVLIPERLLDNDFQFQWKAKVRNNSGVDLTTDDTMYLWFQYLDENGDKLWDSYCFRGSSYSTEAGQAEWILQSTHPAEWTNNETTHITTLKIYAYNITPSSEPEFQLAEPIVINLRDYFEWK